ncbi:MAG TPA: alpha/beta hydrolase [Actinomycetes bacterium]|jgi:alpha-beta hydrolase superfamily lysophospholipase|nr:alpha/beta hydrolase [Actinomycetes bacterium]
MDDIDLVLDDTRGRFNSIPCFLYGHSLGGLLVLAYALRRGPALTGVVASGPAVHTALREQYEGLYHEIHNEPERQRMFDDLVHWLRDHVSPPERGRDLLEMTKGRAQPGDAFLPTMDTARPGTPTMSPCSVQN